MTSAVDSEQNLEFTYDTYRDLLEQLRSQRYQFKTFDDQIGNNEIVLRHDVDWSPAKALRMGEIEQEYDVSSTYFFMLSCPLYNTFSDSVLGAVEELQTMGHEVGLHFSSYPYWDEDVEPSKQAIEARVQSELNAIGTRIEGLSSAVSFHMPPDWVFGESFDSFVNTYGEHFFNQLEYIADSRQRWRSEHPFADGYPDRAQILVHPGSWGDEDASFGTRIEHDIEAKFEDLRRQFQSDYRVDFDST
ncbi:hypothetical protein [Halorubrum sp. SD626R]|uniref:hypothetical protein n=1 Tax=Halorubrum sp. SD626R TaxID=1419722 RepID=UPI000A8D6619|nr:hypothetical protein [Halorubrum sp. SD626R]TKX82260.1 hypothetical protein EXE53_01235 [Halorubrum sp. SD626R]